MYLKSLEISGFKSFAKKSTLDFSSPISAIVGPNGSGKSNVAEAFRFVLGEQSIKSLRGKKGEDLIFNGTAEVGRLNRASVKVVFDNLNRVMPIDFDEVSIERIVHRDSINEYLINGSQVRLKDIVELLSTSKIGISGHNIISQGEADKILNANLKERRQMVEDALGLKVYQHKKIESERKLEKTRENISQVESLRKEIAPHLRFLKKQVEKIEKGIILKNELIYLYKEYFKREDTYIKNKKEHIKNETKGPKEELSKLVKEIDSLKIKISSSDKQNSKTVELARIEDEIRKVETIISDLNREVGRTEGEISSLNRMLERQKEAESRDESKKVLMKDVESVLTQIDINIKNADKESDVGAIKKIFQNIKQLIANFISSNKSISSQESKDYQLEINKLKDKKTSLENEISSTKKNEEKYKTEHKTLKNQIEKEKEGSLEAEKDMFKLMTRQNELHSILSSHKAEEDRLILEEEDFKRELTESVILAGREAINFEKFVIQDLKEDRTVQLERRRNIEKIKIRLEEMGAGSSDDIMKEYKEAEERDRFLMSEIEDLEKSAQSLDTLIVELGEKIDNEFRNGTQKINLEFQKFFSLMFGGGSASLLVVKPPKRKSKDDDTDLLALNGQEVEEVEESEEGIDISVSLPHKKTKGLMMLSGGERALTSIALLFAISQVNPPPFIIL
ncbi:AAA family ATPase, partial [Candidatus Nomurabacteria bacterium]|nr:AAA family ATPase [Candidatus Nomurabacteria bacterium]